MKVHGLDGGFDLATTHDARVFDDAVTVIYTGVTENDGFGSSGV